jgi:excinuclease ABC subunit A
MAAKDQCTSLFGIIASERWGQASRGAARAVDAGNTVVTIEHNLEVIRTADWIIDLGPEGGDGAGEIVAQGTPEDIVKAKRSYTGQFLAPVLAWKEARGKVKKRIEAAE